MFVVLRRLEKDIFIPAAWNIDKHQSPLQYPLGTTPSTKRKVNFQHLKLIRQISILMTKKITKPKPFLKNTTKSTKGQIFKHQKSV